MDQFNLDLIDFRNIGGLAQARTRETILGLWTHYSWRELFIRGGLVVATTVCGMVAARSCEEQTCSPLTRGFFGATGGFVAAHVVVMVPTLQRRYKIKAEGHQIYLDILNKIQNFEQSNITRSNFSSTIRPLLLEVSAKTSELFNFPLPVEKRGDVARNLMIIKRLMVEVSEIVTTLLEALQNNTSEEDRVINEATEFWDQDVAKMIKDFLEPESSTYATTVLR